MDKKAREKIAELPFPGEKMFARLNYQVDLMSPARGSVVEAYRLAQQDMLEAGYRKPPEGKPPLLSENPYGDWDYPHHSRVTQFRRYDKMKTFEAGKEAQRDSDWKWFKGGNNG